MGELFQQIAKTHTVPQVTVLASLGRNRPILDLGMVLSFVLLYSLAASMAARTLWRRYPPVQCGWTAGAIMSLFVAFVFASLSTMAGEQWNWIFESHRVGNSHMSYRVQRLWWGHHRPEVFVGALFIFGFLSLAIARRQTRVEDTRGSAAA